MRTAREIKPDDELETATFSMGCFWGPEALFGSKDGVMRTRVGYAGGEKEHPSYRSLGDHTETVQLDYDPEKISYEELLELFWQNHDYTSQRKTQYASKIFCHTERQKQLAEESKKRHEEEHGNVETEILPADTFWSQRSSEKEGCSNRTAPVLWLAEDYHQKYHLRQRDDLMERFSDLDPEDFINSEEAAKMNGVAAGYRKD